LRDCLGLQNSRIRLGSDSPRPPKSEYKVQSLTPSPRSSAALSNCLCPEPVSGSCERGHRDGGAQRPHFLKCGYTIRRSIGPTLRRFSNPSCCQK
jgi:hypothetical protein